MNSQIKRKLMEVRVLALRFNQEDIVSDVDSILQKGRKNATRKEGKSNVWVHPAERQRLELAQLKANKAAPAKKKVRKKAAAGSQQKTTKPKAVADLEKTAND